MRHLAAYALAVLGGNPDPSEADVKKILESVGAEVDSNQLSQVLKALKGKALHEVISEGLPKLQAIPSGGGSGPAPVATSAKQATEKVEEKKEEKPKEEPVEDALAGGMDLFGGEEEW